jgi:signal transduction histidine kinase
VPSETTDPSVFDSENPSPSGASADRPGPPDNEKEEASEAPLRERLSEVYHDLNNSLAVISGNAQLLTELARAEDLGPAFTDPLDDVEAARADISEALDRLDRLRAQADQRENHE